MIPRPNLKEEKMGKVSSLGAILVFAVGVAFAAPISALASDGAQPVHKHAVHRMAHAGLTSNAIALAPVQTLAPAASDSNGLSRDSGDCNRGCIDH
jgi:hypothetical protein